MKNIIKKIKPLYFILNKIRHFKIEIIFTNIHYFICLVLKKPYFGKKYGANIQSKKEREILRRLVKQVQNLKENIKLNVLNIINDENAEITIDNIINNIMLKFNNYNLDITKGHRNIRIKGLYKTRTIFIEIEKDKVLFNKEYWEEVKSVHWRGGKYRQYLKNEFIKKNYITFDFNDYNSVQESIENQILIEINKSKIYKA